MADTKEQRLLAGFYDPVKREKQVLQRLEEELKIFRTLDFTKDIAPQLPQSNGAPSKPTLVSIEKEIKDLIDEVNSHSFEGGHFTKQYRTFQGGFDKLLQQLDSVDIGGDQGQREKRGSLIKTIQDTVNKINGKVHENGKCCPECELYGTMWQ